MAKKQIGKLGKGPKKHDNRNLQMARYVKGIAPTLPKVDHATKLRNIGQMGNDVWNSCTCSAAGHMIQSWSVYADRGQINIPDNDIIDAYKIVQVGDDGGAYALDVLNLWHKTGIGGEKIEAFVEVAPADLTQAKLAVMYFGSCYIGMGLPDQNLYGPWTTVTGPSNRNNGHMVNIVAYDDDKQMFRVCTWGAVWNMSYAWYQKYCDEAYAVADDLSLNETSGLTPEGFDWNALMADINNLDEAPDDGTTPTPTPTPTDDNDKKKSPLIPILIGGAVILAIVAAAILA